MKHLDETAPDPWVTFTIFDAPALEILKWISAVYHLRDENVFAAGGLRARTMSRTHFRELSQADAVKPMKTGRDTSDFGDLVKSAFGRYAPLVRLYDLSACPGVCLCEGIIDPIEPEARTLPLGLICAVAQTTLYWLRGTDFRESNRADLEILGGAHSGRVVSVYREDGGRWKFFQKGKPAPFETVEMYEERLIRKRLSLETILRYADAIAPGLKQDWQAHEDFRCYEVGHSKGAPVSQFEVEAQILKSRKGLGFQWF